MDVVAPALSATDAPEIASRSPVRVMHLIGGLSGGGLERWLFDIIRLSASADVSNAVLAVYADMGGAPVYAGALAALGVLANARAGPIARALRYITERARARKSGLAHGLLSLPLRAAACAVALPRAIRLYRRHRPDVIHSHSGPDILLGVLLKILFRKPLVHTVPCLFSQMEQEGYRWLPGFYRRAHRWIDLFSTGEAKGELVGVGIPESKIMYDLAGIDLDLIERASSRRPILRSELLGRLSLPENSVILLSTGRLHASKGHVHGIEALAALIGEFPCLHLLILGEGVERPALEERIRSLGLSRNVHLLGYVPDPHPIFAAADIYLRTTLLEPENLSFYLAMGAGLPAVGFDTGWPDLIAKVGHGRLVPMLDSQALAKAVRDILLLPDCGRSLGALGREHAALHLDLRLSVSQLADTYRRLARSALAPAPALIAPRPVG